MPNYHARRPGVIGDAGNFKTKKSLREAVAAGEDVDFIDTTGAAFGNRGTVKASDLLPADVVVGPDPYKARNWFANVKNGRVT